MARRQTAVHKPELRIGAELGGKEKLVTQGDGRGFA
jgi:hypothetical protein